MEYFQDMVRARSEEKPLDPAPSVLDLHHAGPMVRIPLHGSPLRPWVVTRWEEARVVLASPGLRSQTTAPGYPVLDPQAPVLPRGFFFQQDAPVHTVFRRALTPEFMVRRVEELRAPTERFAGRLLDDLITSGGTPDLVEKFALPLPSFVISELLGIPHEDRDAFQEMANTLVGFTVGMADRMAAGQRMAELLEGLIAAKRAEPGDDLISRMVPHIDDGTFTTRDAADVASMMLVGGHETTSHMISLSTLALLDHPDQIAHLHDDPAAQRNAVEELLRYLSIVAVGLTRANTEDIVVGDQTIRAGDGVIILLNAVNRDDRVFRDPDRLDLTRTDARRHLAFGYGVHVCLGQPLARMELQVALPELFRRLPGLRIAPGETVRFHNAPVYGVEYLPVTW